MTKLRPPASIEDAVTRIGDRLGWERAGEVVQKHMRTLRKWSDPDSADEISVKDACRLDAAYVAEVGGHPPFLAAYQHQLKIAAAEACADHERFARRVTRCAREAGQALSALFTAALPTASREDRLIAAREAQEAIEAFSDTLPDLRGPGPGPASAPEVAPPARIDTS